MLILSIRLVNDAFDISPVEIFTNINSLDVVLDKIFQFQLWMINPFKDYTVF